MGIEKVLSQAREFMHSQFSPDSKSKEKEVKPDDVELKSDSKKKDENEESGQMWVELNAITEKDNVNKKELERLAEKSFKEHKAEVQRAKALIAEKIDKINERNATFSLEVQSKAVSVVLKEMGVDRDTEVGAVVTKTVADALVANMIKTTLDVNPPETPEEINEYNKVVEMIKPLTAEGDVDTYTDLKSKEFKEKAKVVEPEPGAAEIIKALDKVVVAVEGVKDAQNVGNVTELPELIGVLRQFGDSVDQILQRDAQKRPNAAPIQEPEVVVNKPKAKEREINTMSWEELKERRRELLDIDGTLSRDDAIKNKRELKGINEEMTQKWKKAQKELENEGFYLKKSAVQAIDAGKTHPTQDPLEIAESYLDMTAKGVENNKSLNKETREIAKDWLNNVKEKWDLEKERELSRRTDIGQEDRATYANNTKEKEREFKNKDWGKRSDPTESAIVSLVVKSIEKDAKTDGTKLKRSIDEEAKTIKDREELMKNMMGRGAGMGMGPDMDSESALKYTIWMNRLQLRPDDLKAVKDGENEDEIRTIFKRLVQRIEIDDDILNDPNNLKFLLFYMDHELKGKNPALVNEITDFVSNRIYFSQVVSRFDSLAQDDFSEQTLTSFNSEIRVNFTGTNADRMGKLYGAAMKYMLAMEDPAILKELFDSAKADGKMEDLQSFFRHVALKAHADEEGALQYLKATGSSSETEELNKSYEERVREWIGEAKFAFRMQRFTLRVAEVDAAYKNGTNLGPAFNGKNLQDLLGSGFKVKRDIGNSKILQVAGQVEMFGFNTFLARKLGAALANKEISDNKEITKLKKKIPKSDKEKDEIDKKIKELSLPYEEKYSDSNIGINREGRVVNLVSIRDLSQMYKENICEKAEMSDEALFEQIFSDHDQIVGDYFGKFKDAHATRTKLLGILTSNPQDRIKMAGDVFKVWLHRAGDKLTPGSSVEDNGLGFSFFEDDYFSREEAEKYKDYDKRHLAAMRMYFAIFEDAEAAGIDPMVLRYWAEKGIIENVGVDKRAHMLDLLDLSLMKKSTMIGFQLGGLFWAIVSSMVKVTLNIK